MPIAGGLNCSKKPAASSLQRRYLGKQLPASHSCFLDIMSAVGDIIKLREVPKALSTKSARKLADGRGNDLGYGKNDRDDANAEMDYPQPSPKPFFKAWMQFTD